MARSIVFTIVGRDDATPALNKVGASAIKTAEQVESSTRKMTSAFLKAGKVALGLGATFGAFEAAKKAIDITKEATAFQSQMRTIQTQAGASAAEVTKMSSAVLKLTGPLAQSPMALAKSLYLVESAGYRGATALNIETNAAKLADIGHSDLTKTTDALVGVLQTGLTGGAKNAASTVAQLNAIVGSGKMTMDDFVDAIGTGIVASAKTFGVSLQSVGAALALMTDEGTPAASAATHLKMSMALLAAPTKQASLYLKEAGLSSADAGVKVSAMQEILQKSGVTTTTLATDLRKPDGFLVALTDLKTHMVSAGLTANEQSALISRAFGGGKSGGPIMQMLANLDLLKTKFESQGTVAKNFGKDWTATTQTLSFQVSSLEHYLGGLSLSLMGKLMPAEQSAATWFGTTLPHAVAKFQQTLAPTERIVGVVLVGAFKAFAGTVKLAYTALTDWYGLLGSHASIVNGTVEVVLAMWAAFKGYTIARAAFTAISEGFVTLRANAAGGLTSMRAYGTGVTATLQGTGTEAQLTSLIMQAEFDKVTAAALAEAAAIDEAAASEATANAAKVASAEDSSSAQVLAADRAAAAALAQARASAIAAGQIAASADASATAVQLASSEAEVGWGSILGPVGLAVTGIAVLTTALFHNHDASQAAAAAQQSYATSLKKTTDLLAGVNVQQTITNLSQDKAYDQLDKISSGNKTLGLSYNDLASAVNGSQAQFNSVVATLQAVENSNTVTVTSGKNVATGMNAQGKAAQSLVGTLGTLRGGLHTGQQEQLALNEAQREANDLTGKSVAASQTSATAAEHATMVEKQRASATAAATAAASKQASILGVTVTAYNAAAAAAKKSTAQTKAQTLQYQLENDAADLLAQTLDHLDGKNLAWAQSQNDVQQGLVSLVQGIKGGSTAFTGLSSDAITNRGNLQSLITTVEQAAGVYGNLKKSTVAGRDELVKLRTEIINNAIAGGANRKVITDMVDSLLKIPATIKTVDKTKLDLDNSAAMRKVQQLQTTIANIRQNGALPHLDIDTSAAVQKIAQLQVDIQNLQGKTVNPGLTAIATNAGHRDSTTHEVAKRVTAHAAVSEGRSGSGRLFNLFAGASPPGIVTVSPKHKTTSTSGSHSSTTKKPHPTYTVNGEKYSSKTAAENAQTRLQKSLEKATASFQSVVGQVGASLSSLQSAAKALLSAAKADGINAKTLAKLQADQTRLIGDAKKRDAIASRLGTAPTGPTAYDKLATAKQNYSDAKSAVASAITGSFDITTAGVNTQVYADKPAKPVSASSILAQLRTAVANAQKFARLLKKLAKEGLPKSLLIPLADAGPAAMAQAQALAGATPKTLAAIINESKALSAAGTAGGTTVADKFYQSGITSAQKLIAGLKSQEKALDKAISEIGISMIDALDKTLNLPPVKLHQPARHKKPPHVHGGPPGHNADDVMTTSGGITVHQVNHFNQPLDEQAYAAMTSRRMVNSLRALG